MYEEFSEVSSEAFFGISSKIRPPTAQEGSLGRALLERTADLVNVVISWRGNVEQYIRFSHEWYDGSGYPLGLAADEIPVGARIIAIASSADLLAREYRLRRRSPDDAFDVLRRHSGTSFDPSLVDAFVESHQVRVLLQSDREA
jgi:putative two-component system response regulator